MTAGLTFLGLILVLVFSGHAISNLVAPVFGRWWRVFVAPGIIFHELAHALACVITGAHVHEINFWKPTGGHVVHGQPRLPIVGSVLISFAPTIFTVLIFAIISSWLTLPASAELWFNRLPTDFFSGAMDFFWATVSILISINWLNWLTWLGFYAVLNVAVTIAPSRTDLHNAKWSTLALIFIIFGLGWLLKVNLSLTVLWPLLAWSSVYLAIALFAGLVVWLIGRIVASRRARKHPHS